MLDALRLPLRRLLYRAALPPRSTSLGKLYLGRGQPVVLLPAFGGGPESTAALRTILDEAGFATYDWGLGVDAGAADLGLDQCLPRFEEQVIEVFESERRPVSLLGWGLSGIYAREVAKRINPLVRQVITLGAPFNSAAQPGTECAMLATLASTTGRMDPSLRNRLRQRPPVPCTTIFSRGDELVPWRMSVETETVISENVEVPACSHRRLAGHPKVLEVITNRLAQPDGEWLPFDV
ncbi:MAG: alpha/beta hydrolase [Ramlibacter sp.]|nr:alpha/beta hydrolase [Ramlibacter sp.]